MTRTRAEALALVNWKGVFYERYLLDRHVTALEGANGAGKTTVMIAAYVVLLPDMSRLRFTNLGETGATGGDKGIWGRLGEQGRPSYAVIDFVLPGNRRFIAGVHLERKGEPSVEPTSFVVTGLSEDVRLQDLLLLDQGNNDVVPELSELRENAARLGGRLQSFSSARDYFATLFDHGVTPLRLGTDEERNKLNEMLRTSMTGGISRALTSELRAFMLKEEAGLADTLQRMRANLDACRRTRTEVQEAQRLEREIGAVFEAGQMMFAAAFRATRERAEELTRRLEEAKKALAGAIGARSSAQEALEKTITDLETLERQRTELADALTAAREWKSRLRDALSARNVVVECIDQLERATKAANDADALRADAETLRNKAREALRKANDGYGLAADGLANFQAGLQELHRRADAYHQVVRRFREATERLGDEALNPESFSARITVAERELAIVDGKRRDGITRLSDAEDHRKRHRAAIDALRAILSREIAAGSAHDVALEILERQRQQAILAGRLDHIEHELAETLRQAAKQSKAREQARALGIVLTDEPAPELVARFLNRIESDCLMHENSERSEKMNAADAARRLNELTDKRRDLIAREPDWREHTARVVRLAGHAKIAVDDLSSLSVVRTILAEQTTAATRAEEKVREAYEECLREARELLAAGGPFSHDLLRLKDRLGGELVAASFDDVAIAEAARLEARLGRLAQALVVDDPTDSARALHNRADSLSDVLLIPRDADLDKLCSPISTVDVGERDVAVEEGIALRVSRVPSHPCLGRRAREQRAAQLRDEAENKARELDTMRAARRDLERLVADGEALLAGQAVWLAGDPAPQISILARSIVEVEAAIQIHNRESLRHGEEARALRPRLNAIRNLLGQATYLDPPDYGERARVLEADRDKAQAAKAFVDAHGRHAELVGRELETLRHVPLSAEEFASLMTSVQELKERREQLEAGIDALSYVERNVEALGWEEAPQRLLDNRALVPELKAQLQEAEDEREHAEKASSDADARYDRAIAKFQDADGKRRVVAQAHAAAVERFDSLRVREPSETALAAAVNDVERLEEESRTKEQSRDALLTKRGRRGECAARSAKAIEGSRRQRDQRTSGRRAGGEAVGRAS